MLEPSAMAARSPIRALLARRGPRVGLALAAPGTALFGPRLVAHQHALPVIRARFLEALPPARDLLRRVRAGRAQREEVVRGAEARVLQHAVGTLAAALEEPRLHEPELLHGRVEAPRDREGLALRVQRLVHRRVQRRNRGLPLRLELAQVLLDLAPQERGEEERGRHRLVAGPARVGPAARRPGQGPRLRT